MDLKIRRATALETEQYPGVTKHYQKGEGYFIVITDGKKSVFAHNTINLSAIIDHFTL